MAQAFKNLVDRFNAQMNALYAEGSTTDRDSYGVTKNTQPLYEVKPNTPNKRDFGADTRSIPLNSIAADVTRIGTWLTRPYGLRWMLDQQNLQMGNTFAETRVINPLFVVGNLQPFLHIERSLGNATGLTLTDSPITGGTADQSSGSTTRIGSAGRLQSSTAKHVTNLIVTGGQNNVWQDIISWIPASRIVNTINTLVNVTDVGILGVDQRPEFDMSGQGTFNDLYSVEIWNGFERASGPVDNLAAVGANLRVGNFSGAVQAASAAVKTVSQDINQIIATGTSVVNFVGSLFGSRARGTASSSTPTPTSAAQSSTKAAGRRYFITNGQQGADRYLEGTIDFVPSQDGKTIVPVPSLSFMNRFPTTYESDPILVLTSSTSDQPDLADDYMAITLPTDSATQTSLSPTAQQTQQATIAAGQARLNVLTNLRQGLDIANATRIAISGGPLASAALSLSQLAQGPGRAIQQQLAGDAVNPAQQGSLAATTDNPAEDAMKYAGLSIRERYLTDEKIAEITATIASQKGKWLASYKSFNPKDRGAGFKGGITIDGGQDGEGVIVNSGKKYPFPSVETTNNGTRRYFYDNINAAPPVQSNTTDDYLTKEAMDTLKSAYGTPLVDLFFYDYVNKVAVPFRANIRSLNEAVAPEYNDTFYIGRTERNIVYIGVRRSVSFSLIIHAYNEIEMTGIWEKLNYLTSLCFPSQYSQGYMVPPLIKLTMGDVYNNQPGYIQSLTYNIEDDTPWEITEPLQAPHGITANITFAIIEKTAQHSDKYNGYNPFSALPTFVPLYNYGRKRQFAAAQTPAAPAVQQPTTSITPSTDTIPNHTPGANRGSGHGRSVNTGTAVMNQGRVPSNSAVTICAPVDTATEDFTNPVILPSSRISSGFITRGVPGYNSTP